MSFQHLGVSRKQFLLGLGVGSISTLPLVYSDMFIVGRLVEEALFSLSLIGGSFFGIELIWNMGIFFFCILSCFFLLGSLFSGSFKGISRYVVSFIGMLLLLILLTVFIYIMTSLVGDGGGKKSIDSGSFVFAGIWGITSYYIIVALLEEGVKYISSLNIGTYNNTASFGKVLSCGAVIALGFAFFENILYTYQYILLGGVDSELLKLVFFRSFFTLSLHVLCGMLLSGAFYMLLVLRGKYRFALLLFFLFSILSIFSHMFFDIALTFGYIGVIFIYVFLLYLLMGYITTNE